MAPKSKQQSQFAAKMSDDSSSQRSGAGARSELSVISETSSLLSGDVASLASKVPLKESKTVIRDRKIVFWTPVMVWPAGFVKPHKKETMEYRSDERLHNGKVPYIPVKLAGGVIIDLGTTDIEDQVSQLLETKELATDSVLCSYLDEKVRSLKVLNS
jgi:hypothetical protein